MQYESPELFRIGRLEDHTFGGPWETSQDGEDTYRRKHSDPPDVFASFRRARQVAAANLKA